MVTKSPPVSNNRRDTRSLRKVHRSMALRALSRQPGLSRVDLARQLGLSTMAIGRIVKELDAAGLTREVESQTSACNRGRPPSGLHLQDDGIFVAGAVISAYSQEILLLNLKGELVTSNSLPVADVTKGPEVVALFCKAIKKMITKSDIPPHRIAGVGFAVAATVDPNQGSVIDSGYLGWPKFDLAKIVKKHLMLPVTVNNIADALLRAEALIGCAREARAALLIHSATTVGASYLYDNELISGARFKAGRIGHFPMQTSNLRCSCGQSNCLNCFASGWSILHQLKIVTRSSYQLKEIQNYSKQIRTLVEKHPKNHRQQKKTEKTFAQAGKALAHGLRLLELTVDPDLFILAGPLSENEAYFNSAEKYFCNSYSIDSESERRITRGTLAPNRAAGVIALLDTVLSPAFDIKPLVSTSQDVRQTA